MSVLFDKVRKIVQHMFKCNEPERMAYKNDQYKHIYTWLKKQHIHYILLDMITVTLLKKLFEITQEYTKFWGSAN